MTIDYDALVRALVSETGEPVPVRVHAMIAVPDQSGSVRCRLGICCPPSLRPVAVDTEDMAHGGRWLWMDIDGLPVVTAIAGTLLDAVRKLDDSCEKESPDGQDP